MLSALHCPCEDIWLICLCLLYEYNAKHFYFSKAVNQLHLLLGLWNIVLGWLLYIGDWYNLIYEKRDGMQHSSTGLKICGGHLFMIMWLAAGANNTLSMLYAPIEMYRNLIVFTKPALCCYCYHSAPTVKIPGLPTCPIYCWNLHSQNSKVNTLLYLAKN